MFPVLFLLLGFGSGALPSRLGAQGLVRAWLPWRTIETRHFAFHYPAELEDWTRAAASHVEAIDSAVTRVVGYTPAAKTHVIVDDPYEVANGSAWPYLNQPLINLWATPPDPRDDIGEFRVWGAMLLSHEFTHIAHLSRPSRNAQMRRLWEALPVDLGPIPINAPRWVVEGYATYVEGKVSGSGRPHGVWRAAFLRQWALEGQLPRYENLDAWGAYNGGEFAYLAGSAFLDWLTHRPGASDSSLVDLWRRMTAKQTRSFDEAFVGVFGDSPRVLYGLFVADVMADAREAARLVHAPAPADTGTIVQRLSWGTGDPAISPDGRHVALVLRSPVRPSRVVIWSTQVEPDTTRARRDSILRARDPQDVPARPIYPPPKRVIASLVSSGSSYEDPRFLADGRILLWKNTPRGDGSLVPDLYLWDPRHGTVRRITHGASVRDADPAPDGHHAYAMHCHAGTCDLALVNLISGAVTTVLPGSPTVSYYRPRVRPSGSDILVAMHDTSHWRLVLVSTRTHAVRPLAAPDSASRYDGAWASEDDAVAVSDAGGVPNIEYFNINSSNTPLVTRVTGAAVAPEVDPRDHMVWFLSLYSRGYDLRTAALSAQTTAAVPALPATLVPAVPVPSADTVSLPANSVSSPKPFSLAERQFRWIPAPQLDADGVSAVLGLASTDLIGRSEVLAKLGAGDRAAWHGAALDLTWRGFRPFLHAQVFDAMQTLTDSRAHASVSPALDTHLAGGMLSLDGSHQADAWAGRLRIGGSVASVTNFASHRSLALADAGATFVQRGDQSSVSESFAGNVAGGNSFNERFARGVASASFATVGFGPFPVIVAGTYARVSSGAPPFEQIASGGNPSPLIDRSLLGQRIAMPALPTGIQVGPSAVTYRVTVRAQPMDFFYWGGSTAGVGDRFARWNRVAGFDWTMSLPNFALAGTPAARAEYGVGYSFDAPFRHTARAYVSLVLDP